MKALLGGNNEEGKKGTLVEDWRLKEGIRKSMEGGGYPKAELRERSRKRVMFSMW